MSWYRIRHTIGMFACGTGRQRAAYLKKHNILYSIGNNCMVMFRKIPLYPKLISLGDNVWIASDVSFINPDVIHRMLNNAIDGTDFQEKIGRIDIKSNVFVGANSTILPDVVIGSNTVIAAGSLVNSSIPGNGVYGGVPAKYICSLDSLIEKRRREPRIQIIGSKRGGLAQKTIEDCWKRCNEKQEQRGEKQ